MDKRECPRCAFKIEAAVKFCPECGAPVSARGTSAKAPASQVSWTIKALLGMMGALLLLGTALLVLLLERPPQSAAAADPYAVGGTATPQAQASPGLYEIYSDQQAQEGEENPILGVWVASRIQSNTKKSKTLLADTNISFERATLCFLPDGLLLAVDGESATQVRSWYGEGQDYFVDYGVERVGERDYFGRTRYFLQEDELLGVYTLDGIEVTDFIVFARVQAEE